MYVSKSDYERQLLAYISGVKKYLHKQTITLKGKKVDVADLVKTTEAHLADRVEIDTTRATLQRLTKHDDAVRASLTPVFAALRSYIVNLYGDDSNEAREFGIKPRKAQKRSLASKVEAVAKERATKAAHHAHPAIVNGVNGASNGASHA